MVRLLHGAYCYFQLGELKLAVHLWPDAYFYVQFGKLLFPVRQTENKTLHQAINYCYFQFAELKIAVRQTENKNLHNALDDIFIFRVTKNETRKTLINSELQLCDEHCRQMIFQQATNARGTVSNLSSLCMQRSVIPRRSA